MSDYIPLNLGTFNYHYVIYSHILPLITEKLNILDTFSLSFTSKDMYTITNKYLQSHPYYSKYFLELFCFEDVIQSMDNSYDIFKMVHIHITQPDIVNYFRTSFDLFTNPDDKFNHQSRRISIINYLIDVLTNVINVHYLVPVKPDNFNDVAEFKYVTEYADRIASSFKSNNNFHISIVKWVNESTVLNKIDSGKIDLCIIDCQFSEYEKTVYFADSIVEFNKSPQICSICSDPLIDFDETISGVCEKCDLLQAEQFGTYEQTSDQISEEVFDTTDIWCDYCDKIRAGNPSLNICFICLGEPW